MSTMYINVDSSGSPVVSPMISAWREDLERIDDADDEVEEDDRRQEVES